MMLARSFTQRFRGGRLVGLAVLLFGLMALALGASAGASTGSSKPGLAPASVTKAGAADRWCTKKIRKHCKKKPGLGGLRPKQHKAPKAPPPSSLTGLPAAVDLTAFAVPAGDQGPLGSCVTWAIDYAMLGWYSRHDARPGQPFHPMYTFSQIKKPDGQGGFGSYPEDALKIALKQGTDTMAHYRHTLTDYGTPPNAAEMTNAASYKISGYETLFSNANLAGGGASGTLLIEKAIAAGKPVAIQMRLRPGFYALDGRNLASMTTANDIDAAGVSKGLHEVLALGYDKDGLIIQNSWGADYGYKGRVRLSWKIVSQDVISAHTISGFAPSQTAPPAPHPAPTMGAVAQQIPLGDSITDTTTPVKFSWSASSVEGAVSYEVYVRTDSGDYWKQDIPATATEYTWALAFGSTYRVAVRARDGSGQWSGYSYSAQVSPGLTDDVSFGDVGPPWGRYSLTGTYGGTYIASAQAGSSVTLPFTGTDIALIPVEFNTAGRSTIYCDGSATAVGDFYSATIVTRQVGAFCHFAQSGEHTMKVVPEGTSGRPWLAADAFVTL
jgi:hypothetical protein